MARAAGAAISGRGTFLPTFGGLPGPADPGRVRWEDRPLLVASERTPWEVYVDRHGRRFVAEDEPSIDVRERRLAGLDDLTFWTVFDDRAVEESPGIVVGWSPEHLRAQANRRPGVYSGPNVEALARLAGVEPQGLAATMAPYNGFVRAGHDAELGRRALPAPIERPPYYAMRNHGVTLITFAGVDVDAELRVRRPDGSVIEGLYAIGEVIGAGATSGNSFCGGMAVTPALAFGRWLGARLALAAHPGGRPTEARQG
jgi:fumarate reductase flavoprotein subunit